MNVTERWLYFLMEGQMVERFHSRPLLKPITDAHHQHGVAMLCFYLYGLRGSKPSVNLLMAALTHDLAEQAASDVSAPTKRAMDIRERLQVYEDSFLAEQGLKFNLTKEEQHNLKLADQFEGMLTCVRERFYGNRFVNLMYWKWYEWTLELIRDQDPNVELVGGNAAMYLREAINQMWQWADSGEAPIYDVFTEVNCEKT